MSRVNVEQNISRRVRLDGPTFNTVKMTLSGTFIIGDDAPTFLFLNGGASDRTIVLPERHPKGGQLYFIINEGLHTLTIVDHDSTLVGTVTAQRSGFFMSNADDWGGFVESASGISGDVVGPNVSVDDHIAVFDGASGKLIADSGISIADIEASGGSVTAVATAANPSYVEGENEPLSLTLEGKLRVYDEDVEDAIGNVAITLGPTTMANSVPVTLATDQTPLPITSANETFINKGYQQDSSLGTATNFAPPSGATLGIFTVEASNVRWRDDGVDPTASVGMLLTAGQTLIYNGDLDALKFIDVTSGASVSVSFYQ